MTPFIEDEDLVVAFLVFTLCYLLWMATVQGGLVLQDGGWIG